MEKSRLMIGAKLVIALVICEAAGLIGSLFTVPAISTWYVYLNKPVFTPSGSTIGAVWTVLYILMGISFFMIWMKNNQKKKVWNASIWFLAQLVLNALWSVLFFGLHSPIAGLVCILALLVVLVITTSKFIKISEIAGILLIPYIIWGVFATVLNAAIVVLN